ncbi:glycosyltransferase [Deinococcus sp. ME38]|uniref:glycosyltransferase n=1 Tax=Deinococcus sp. ME38 TaxID=3400344 RepID=UPI003B5B3785
MKTLEKDEEFDWYFFGSANNPRNDGILEINPNKFKNFSHIPTKPLLKGKFLIQPKIISVACSKEYDVVIFLGDPNILTTWLSAILAKLTGKRVGFWAHGWIKQEGYLLTLIRRVFFSLADFLLVYNVASRERGIRKKYPAEKIYTVFNSLNYEYHSKLRILSKEERPIDIICIARLTKLKRLDLLLRAAAIAGDRLGRSINVTLIGDGPELENLSKLSRDLHISVDFKGSMYQEKDIALLMNSAKICVSPGQIGLTAMHSLVYGLPTITHARWDKQMPEYEAIIEGINGSLFEYDDVQDLAKKIEQWLLSCEMGISREDVASPVDLFYNPDYQVKMIKSAIIGEAPSDGFKDYADKMKGRRNE